MIKTDTLIPIFKKTHTLGIYHYLRYLLLIPIRVKVASGYLFPNISLATAWLFKSREVINFTYDLTPTNKLYLAHVISIVTGQDIKKIKIYIRELDENKTLKRYFIDNMDNSAIKYRSGPYISYGRRIGWYVFVRALKPKIVVETGVDQGMGSCIIAEALIKNEKEGVKGAYFGTDILPTAGALFNGKYDSCGKILYGDSLQSLRKFKGRIDLFINDSDHHSAYETKEYETVRKLLKDNSVILGDNSRESEALCEFAEKTHRKFIFFKEDPKNHWYPGAGIGIAYGR
jgi:hypothetical protein